jgi:hypothetical protein
MAEFIHFMTERSSHRVDVWNDFGHRTCQRFFWQVRRAPKHLRRCPHSPAGVLPQSRTTIVPRWGHVANLLSPEKLAKILAEFATRCNEQSLNR